jgi:GNAT superfamily N-acetyltransferase
VVLSNENPKARSYLKMPVFCNFASFGNNIVVSVSPNIAGFVSGYIKSKTIEECFTVPNIFILNDELQKHGWHISFCAVRTLPDTDMIEPIPCQYEMKILQAEDYSRLYGKTEWGNAIGSGRRRHQDRIAIGAYDGTKLIGLAGSSADCDTMWQVGVDVLPEYRRKGIASSLVTNLTVEILNMRFLPYSGYRWANVRSQKTQLAIGFKPTWVDMLASPIDTAVK